MFTLQRRQDPLTLLAGSAASAAGSRFLQDLDSRKENKLIQEAFSDLNEDATPMEYLTKLAGLNVSPDKKNVLLEGFKKVSEEKEKSKTAAREEASAKKTAEYLGIPYEQVKGLTSKQIIDTHKSQQTGGDKKTISERPTDPEQLQAIQDVEKTPGFDDLDEVQQYRAYINAGVSRANAEASSKLKSQQLKREDEAVERSYKHQENFINEVTDTYKGFETEMKPRLLQMKTIPDDKLIGPTSAAYLEKFNIPLGILEDPSNELYDKLSQDLLKGLPETYGNRILKVEVDNFLKTIPRLVNSPNGRRMIASNMLKLGEIKEAYYNAMRNEQQNILKSGKKFPLDFKQQILDQVKPQLDRLNQEFAKMAKITSVPEGTIPFFNPSGEIEFIPKEHAQWAEQNQGKRIW